MARVGGCGSSHRGTKLAGVAFSAFLCGSVQQGAVFCIHLVFSKGEICIDSQIMSRYVSHVRTLQMWSLKQLQQNCFMYLGYSWDEVKLGNPGMWLSSLSSFFT